MCNAGRYSVCGDGSNAFEIPACGEVQAMTYLEWNWSIEGASFGPNFPIATEPAWLFGLPQHDRKPATFAQHAGHFDPATVALHGSQNNCEA